MWQLFWGFHGIYLNEPAMKVPMQRILQSCNCILSLHAHCLIDKFLSFRCRSVLCTQTRREGKLPLVLSQ